MRSTWTAVALFGGACFLTMGLPVLLAVGATGFLSANVWLTLAVALVGFGGLATYMIRRGGCQRCQEGKEVQGWQHTFHRKPADEGSR